MFKHSPIIFIPFLLLLFLPFLGQAQAPCNVVNGSSTTLNTITLPTSPIPGLGGVVPNVMVQPFLACGTDDLQRIELYIGSTVDANALYDVYLFDPAILSSGSGGGVIIGLPILFSPTLAASDLSLTANSTLLIDVSAVNFQVTQGTSYNFLVHARSVPPSGGVIAIGGGSSFKVVGGGLGGGGLGGGGLGGGGLGGGGLGGGASPVNTTAYSALGSGQFSYASLGVFVFNPPSLAFDISISNSALAPVPTLSQWGLIVLALLMLGMAVVAMRVRAVAGSGFQLSSGDVLKQSFDKVLFAKMLVIVLLGLVAVFSLSIMAFGYELTAADVPGSLMAAPIAAFVLMMVGRK